MDEPLTRAPDSTRQIKLVSYILGFKNSFNFIPLVNYLEFIFNFQRFDPIFVLVSLPFFIHMFLSDEKKTKTGTSIRTIDNGRADHLFRSMNFSLIDRRARRNDDDFHVKSKLPSR